MVVNTTWEKSLTYFIKDFELFPKTTCFYHFDRDHYIELSASQLKDFEELYYQLPFINSYELSSFGVLIPSKSYYGGTKLPDDDKCKDIFFEINRRGTCWFTSLINVMFFSDDVSSLCLNQSMKAMSKTIKYIDKFVFTNKDKPLDKINNRNHVNHIFYLISFMYSSYYILAKDRFDEEVKNKKKWYEIMNKIANPDFNTKLTLFLVTTKNITKR